VAHKTHKCNVKRKALVLASKDIGLEINPVKAKYMVMPRDQNAGRSHSINIDNTARERIQEFIYLGTTLSYQNSIQEETKRRLKSGNACYHPVQNILLSCLISKNSKI
jgi:hypothetical protein